MPPQDLYAVYGASGCGRGVMPLARQQLAQAGVGAERLVFVDDAPGGPAQVNGQRVLTYQQFMAEPAAARHAVLAIADGGVRAWTVAAANVVRMDELPELWNVLRGPLRNWPQELLDESSLRQQRYFNPTPIRQKWAEPLSGQRNWQYHLCDVPMFQAWLENEGGCQ